MKTYKELKSSLVEDGEVPMNNTTNALPDKEPVVKKKDALRYMRRKQVKEVKTK